MTTVKVDLGPRPMFKRGDRVSVLEEGITVWTGSVNSVKPSKESGWWVEVERDDGVMGICLSNGTKVEKVSDAD